MLVNAVKVFAQLEGVTRLKDLDFLLEKESLHRSTIPPAVLEIWRELGYGEGWICEDSDFEGNYLNFFTPHDSAGWMDALDLTGKYFPFAGDGGSNLYALDNEQAVVKIPTDDYALENVERKALEMDTFLEILLTRDIYDVEPIE